MNSTLNENETKLGVLVFSVDFQVFADGDGFFDEVVEVFGDGGGEACQSRSRQWHKSAIVNRKRQTRTVALQDPEDLVAGDEAHLGDSVRVTEGDTDLGWGETLAGEFDDVLDDFVGGGLEP